MKRIKNKDNHPYFKAYSVIHEGTSKPNIIDDENLPIKWIRSIVDSSKSVLKKGLQFFNGHNQDNSTTNRPTLGRLVGTLTKEIGGKLTQIAIGYFPDKSKVKNMDVCSIEADIFLQRKGAMNIARGIKAITGIALGNSSVDRPAFSGAIELASVQCFDDGDPSKKGVVDSNKGDKQMTYEEFLAAASNFNWLKQAVKDKNVFPSQLGYTVDDLKRDYQFGPELNKSEELRLKLETAQNELKLEKEARAQDLKQNQSLSAKSRIEKMIPEGFTKGCKNWLMETFDPNKIEDLTDEGLKKYIETSPEEYKRQRRAMGLQEEDQKSGDPTQNNLESDKFDVDTTGQSIEDSIVEDILGTKEEE